MEEMNARVMENEVMDETVEVNCTPKVGQESQRKGCRNLWEKNCSVRN